MEFFFLRVVGKVDTFSACGEEFTEQAVVILRPVRYDFLLHPAIPTF